MDQSFYELTICLNKLYGKRIIRELWTADCDSRYICEKMGVTIYYLSQAMKEMKESGLVIVEHRNRKDGQADLFILDRKKWAALLEICEKMGVTVSSENGYSPFEQEWNLILGGIKFMNNYYQDHKNQMIRYFKGNEDKNLKSLYTKKKWAANSSANMAKELYHLGILEYE